MRGSTATTPCPATRPLAVMPLQPPQPAVYAVATMRSAFPAKPSVASNPRSAIVANAAYSPMPRSDELARG